MEKAITIETVTGPVATVFVVSGKAVASARIGAGGVWILRIPGHVWPVTPDMPTARFNSISGDKITETSSKAFKGRKAALAEVARVLKVGA